MNESLLDKLRKKIDTIDTQIIKNLASRQSVSSKIAQYKKTNNYKIHDPNREMLAIRKRCAIASELELEKKYIITIFKVIFSHSKSIQKLILRKHDDFDKKDNK